MRRGFLMLLPVVSGLAAPPSLAGDIAPRPVVVQSITDNGQKIAPGGATAQITGLKKGGDGFVSVRAAPSVKADDLDRLTQDTFVIVALARDWDAADFVGVIYSPNGQAESPLMERCGLPEAPPYFDGLYTGPCKSGWVSKRFVKVLAD